jgi:hypothetical protein
VETDDARRGSSQSILAAYASMPLHEVNEAATRLRVINRVLREVLGWTEQDIYPEECARARGQVLHYSIPRGQTTARGQVLH